MSIDSEKFIFTEEEEKSLVGLLYNHLSLGTTMEVLGELQLEGIKRIDLLRGVFEKLIKKFNLADKLSQENYLLLGMKDFLQKSSLEKWAQDENNKHLQNRAKYFLSKL